MRRLAFGLAALILAALPWGSRAQTTATVYTFVTVDSVEVVTSRLTITGIEQGASAPSTQYVYFSSPSSTSDLGSADLQACHRMALLAMSKPGQYLLTLRPYYSSTYYYASCKLTRVNP
jgi:hypothetical protein